MSQNQNYCMLCPSQARVLHNIIITEDEPLSRSSLNLHLQNSWLLLAWMVVGAMVLMLAVLS
jgi:hypothetical protein